MSPFERFLMAGERIRLEDGERLALIETGKLEVYAVTRADGSFRQQFLVELEAGGAAFPLLDEFNQTETLLYAAQDTTVAECCAQAEATTDSAAVENAVEEVVDAAVDAAAQEIAK